MTSSLLLAYLIKIIKQVYVLYISQETKHDVKSEFYITIYESIIIVILMICLFKIDDYTTNIYFHN